MLTLPTVFFLRNFMVKDKSGSSIPWCQFTTRVLLSGIIGFGIIVPTSSSCDFLIALFLIAELYLRKSSPDDHSARH